ncbi:hypothetical protein F383_03916 [Gossypium arboreum]|uniref:Uncharacterized protein n=1 Tax=Gossypium arboreum TaxID=29729 RepID=A0A0B0PNW7_GOSAR|nr:hypothetical protein F383_12529 [Gossypium arboreum]KHG26557.1 hypothetical protein F383_03916 [Gossypium arboreum]
MPLSQTGSYSQTYIKV